MSDLHFTCLRGELAGPRLDDLARLRIEVFREWPYLYDGDLDYERAYLAAFSAAPGSLLVYAAGDDGTGMRVVGASTAMPLEAAEPAIRTPFEARGRDISDIFYFGESVLERAWRGQGAGHAFFDAREAHARALGAKEAAFCAVVRPEDHPLRDPAYRPLDGFWRKRGYEPSAELTCRLAWKDVDQAEESEKTLAFWTRAL
jgi:GNAT superfamily N-acetyltransferase